MWRVVTKDHDPPLPETDPGITDPFSRVNLLGGGIDGGAIDQNSWCSREEEVDGGLTAPMFGNLPSDFIRQMYESVLYHLPGFMYPQDAVLAELAELSLAVSLLAYRLESLIADPQEPGDPLECVLVSPDKQGNLVH